MKISIITSVYNNRETIRDAIESNYSVLAVGSVATSDLESYGIYQGNPAVKKRERVIA